MALEATVKHLKRLLEEICHDLDKACRGNRAAAQRVRTNTIQLAKVSKDYRKESIADTRKGGKKKAAKKTPAKKKKAAPKKKAAKRVVKRAAPKKKAAKKRR